MSRLPRLSQPDQRRITRAMQVFLLLMIAYGVVAWQPKAITNGTVALLLTLLPALLERNYDLPMDPWLALWVTTAVFLHTLGSSGLYGHISWWDNVTHATSASFVAAVGYTVVRTIDLHVEGVVLPRRFVFVYIFVIVLAFGVLWELFEYALDIVAMETGVTMPLAQHGLDDTVTDSMYNSIGALLVALFGQAYLTGVAEAMRERLFATE